MLDTYDAGHGNGNRCFESASMLAKEVVVADAEIGADKHRAELVDRRGGEPKP